MSGCVNRKKHRSSGRLQAWTRASRKAIGHQQSQIAVLHRSGHGDGRRQGQDVGRRPDGSCRWGVVGTALPFACGTRRWCRRGRWHEEGRLYAESRCRALARRGSEPAQQKAMRVLVGLKSSSAVLFSIVDACRDSQSTTRRYSCRCGLLSCIASKLASTANLSPSFRKWDSGAGLVP